jgi:hypothetical protein
MFQQKLSFSCLSRFPDSTHNIDAEEWLRGGGRGLIQACLVDDASLVQIVAGSSCCSSHELIKSTILTERLFGVVPLFHGRTSTTFAKKGYMRSLLPEQSNVLDECTRTDVGLDWR